MKSISTNHRLLRSVSLSALTLAGVMGLSTAAYAQDAEAAEEEDAIVVTGFRASLENAVAEKKDSDLILESVSAEDIGKLPDASIGESIARLPGLTSQRLNGRSAFISVRGFGPDLSQTLLNGREQTSTGDNRAVEFDQYPSEMVSMVNVYKTPSASLIGQGLVGTIDIRTARPLEVGRTVAAVGVKGSLTDMGKLNSGSGNLGYRVNATYIDQFGSDDSFGVALTASYVDENYQVEEYNAWGYNNYTIGGQTASLIGGSKSFVTSTNLKRLGLGATFQGDLTDNLRVTVDLFYSDFSDDIIKRGIELPLSSGFGWTNTGFTGGVIEDGKVVSGTFTNVEGVVNNHVLERNAKLFSSGYNIDWDATEKLNIKFDWSRSSTDRNELVFESNAGTGRGQNVGATDTISFVDSNTGIVFDPTLDYSNPALIRLTSPMGWGAIAGGQDGYYNDRQVEDKLNVVRLDLDYELGSFIKSVKVGGSWSDRTKELVPDEYFVLLAGGASDLQVPSQYLLNPTNLDYLGLGPMISYDPRALLDAGILVLRPQTDGNAIRDILSKGYTVKEELLTGYVQLDLGADFGSSQLTGNVGVQVVRAKQSSTGFDFLGTTPVFGTRGASYTDVLPSLNLSLRMDSDIVIRLALSRQLQRPRMDDMRLAVGYGIDRTGTTPIIRGGGGNFALEPIRADAADLTIEKYFGDAGYIAAQGFYKKLKNWIYRADQPFDYTGYDLGGEVVPSMIGTINQPLNGEGGEMYGVELAGTLNLDSLTPALGGFGLTGGVSYTKSKLRPEPGQPFGDIDGYSRWVANGTLFFEKWGFNARGSVRYRSSFRGELSGLGGNRVRRRALGETIFDAQIGYDFPETSGLAGLSIFVQGQNLTDEPFVTVFGNNESLVNDYQSYGRRFQAGVTYKF